MTEEHKINSTSGAIIHNWRIGSDIIRESILEDGYYLGTCTICGFVRNWPVFIDEKAVSKKSRLTALMME